MATTSADVPVVSPVVATQPGDLVPYPNALVVKLGDTVYTAAMLPEMRAKYGNYCVVLGRYPAKVVAFVAKIAIIKFGLFGRCMKSVEAAKVFALLAEELDEDDKSQFAGRAEILVSAPPLSGEHVGVIMEQAALEAGFIQGKLPLLQAVDALSQLDESRASAIVEEICRHYTYETAVFESQVKRVEAPNGEWKVYSHRDAPPSDDNVAAAIVNAIRLFARTTVAPPPLPESNLDELEALGTMYDLLADHKFGKAAARLVSVLETPEFIRAKRERRGILEKVRRFGGAPPNATQFLKHLVAEEFREAAFKFEAEKHPSFDFASSLGKSASAATASQTGAIPKVLLDRIDVLTFSEVLELGVAHAPKTETEAFDRLNHFVGGYLGELDLSHTYVTGSAIAASLIVTEVEKCAYDARGESLSRQYDAMVPSRLQTWYYLCTDAGEVREYKEIPGDKVYAVRALKDFIEIAEEPLEIVGRGDSINLSAAIKAAPDGIPTDVMLGVLIRHRAMNFETWKNQVASRGFNLYAAALYPPVTTIPDNNDWSFWRGLAHPAGTTYTYTTIRRPNGEAIVTVTKNSPGQDQPSQATFRIVSGADLDLSIEVESNEEFDRVAAAHYKVVSSYHPHAFMRKILRAGDPARYSYQIECGDLACISTFRQVELYRAKFDHILTHHVGMVRGAYTAKFHGTPTFVLAASMVQSMQNLSSPNYYYFASRKILPQDVVLKYWARGFEPKFPPPILRAILAAARTKPRWRNVHKSHFVIHPYDHHYSQYPSLTGIGNYSVFSAPAELLARFNN